MTFHTRNQLEKKLPAIKNFLTARGAQVLDPTNEFEVLRFKAGSDTGVVYAKATGQLTIPPLAGRALNAYLNQHTDKWRAQVPTPRKSRSNPVMQRLLKRDGDGCFLCRRPLGDDMTIEHLVPLASGGPNHIANLALAHSDCNLRMGHLSVMEKVALRERQGGAT